MRLRLLPLSELEFVPASGYDNRHVDVIIIHEQERQDRSEILQWLGGLKSQE